MKIQPLWLDGPLKGTDHEIDYPRSGLGYQALWPERVELKSPIEVSADSPESYPYNFHKYSLLGRIFIVASRYVDIEILAFDKEATDVLFNYLVTDRAKRAERKSA